LALEIVRVYSNLKFIYFYIKHDFTKYIVREIEPHHDSLLSIALTDIGRIVNLTSFLLIIVLFVRFSFTFILGAIHPGPITQPANIAFIPVPGTNLTLTVR
jgi:hypothetical protein